jgi:hypothetical protein
MLNKHECELVDERHKKLHEASLIQASSSKFATAIIMQEKKDSATLWNKKKDVWGL